MSKPAYMRRYMLDRYYCRRAEAIVQLGGKCVQCGSTVDLEFDHIDPSTKLYGIGKLFSTASEEKLQIELAKCQLLCESCHKEKNKVDNGEAVHGSITMYKYHKCRCDLCRETNARVSLKHTQKYRAKKKQQKLEKV